MDGELRRRARDGELRPGDQCRAGGHRFNGEALVSMTRAYERCLGCGKWRGRDLTPEERRTVERRAVAEELRYLDRHDRD